MITHIPAQEWHSADRKPEDGVDVLGVVGKGKSAYVDIVNYDSTEKNWVTTSGLTFTEVKVTFWTELPNLPYHDISRG